jgi:hypothetical protein
MNMESRQKSFLQTRKEHAKNDLRSMIENFELGLRRAKEALDKDEEPFTSFLQQVPMFVEKAAKFTILTELLNTFGEDQEQGCLRLRCLPYAGKFSDKEAMEHKIRAIKEIRAEFPGLLLADAKKAVAGLEKGIEWLSHAMDQSIALIRLHALEQKGWAGSYEPTKKVETA